MVPSFHCCTIYSRHDTAPFHFSITLSFYQPGYNPQDLPDVVRRVAKFLGRDMSEEEVHRLAQHCSFNSMSKNAAVNNESIMAVQNESKNTDNLKFMRKGKVCVYGIDVFRELCQGSKALAEESLLYSSSSGKINELPSFTQYRTMNYDCTF